MILIGRGGVTITRNHPKSLHVRLTAPLEWRINAVMEKRKLPEEKVKPYTIEMDIKRKKSRDYFSKLATRHIYC